MLVIEIWRSSWSTRSDEKQTPHKAEHVICCDESICKGLWEHRVQCILLGWFRKAFQRICTLRAIPPTSGLAASWVRTQPLPSAGWHQSQDPPGPHNQLPQDTVPPTSGSVRALCHQTMKPAMLGPRHSLQQASSH